MVKERDLEYNLTIKEAYQLFNQDKIVQGTAEIGTESYKREIDDFLRRTNLCYDDYVNVITQSLVNEYIINLRSTYTSVGTINHMLISVRVFLYWCMNEGYMKQFKIKKIKGQEPKLKFCTEEEITKLLEKPKNRNDFVEHRTHTIVSVFLGTGCRLLTLINLKKEDIDFNNKSIIFRHLKNKKVATVPMSPQLEKTLIDYLKHWDTGSDWLFCTVSGEQLKRDTVQQSMARYCKERGLRRINPHALRHTFAREWILNGGNAFMLQHMMTHSSIETTEHYVRLFSDDLRDVNFQQYIPLDKMKTTTTRTKTIRRIA